MNSHQADIIKLCLLIIITIMVGLFVFGKTNTGSQALVTSTNTIQASSETWCPNVCGAVATRQIHTLCPLVCGFGLSSKGSLVALGKYGTPCALVDSRTYVATYGTSDGTNCQIPTMSSPIDTSTQ